MKLLLDTHVLIWLDADPDRVNPKTKALLSDSANTLYVSAASAWEISAKRRKGSLPQHLSAQAFLEAYEAIELPVTIADGELAGELELAHSDPFDRMILAQAQRHGMSLVTSDGVMRAYQGVAIVYAG